LFAVFVVLLSITGCTPAGWTCRADVDGDGKDDTLILKNRLLEIKTSGGKTLELPLEAPALKVQTGDVNGDGIADIALTMYKTTLFHPVLAKRPFFYYLQNDQLVPLWRGSRLSRPFDDFVLCDIDGDGRAELISLEALEDGRRVAVAYRWRSFGFHWIGDTDPFPTTAEIGGGPGGVWVRDSWLGKKHKLQYNDFKSNPRSDNDEEDNVRNGSKP